MSFMWEMNGEYGLARGGEACGVRGFFTGIYPLQIQNKMKD